MGSMEMQFMFLIFMVFCLTVLGVTAMGRGEPGIAKAVISTIAKLTSFDFKASSHIKKSGERSEIESDDTGTDNEVS